MRNLDGPGRQPDEGDCSMQIWVAADACPGEMKELLYRAAERMKIKLTLVANQSLRIPPKDRQAFADQQATHCTASLAPRAGAVRAAHCRLREATATTTHDELFFWLRSITPVPTFSSMYAPTTLRRHSVSEFRPFGLPAQA
jgi:hypothetical protein